MKKETRHPILRAYLFWRASMNPKDSIEIFERYTKKSLQEMRTKQNFHLGGIFRSRRGPYTVLWIDPTTYDLLVVNRKTKKASWKPLYGFLL